MKRFLSIILAALLICSVMMPVSVFAENGPIPVDWDNVDLENIDEDFKMSSISVVNFNLSLEDLENLDGEDIDFDFFFESLEMGTIYPEIDEAPLPDSFKGISYDEASNTLTLKNVRMPLGAISLLAMGDDFKIKLVGYNELMSLVSEADGWGGSITLIGDGELVVNKDGFFPSGIEIYGTDTAAFFKAEKDVNLKVGGYSFAEDEEYDDLSTSIYVEGSTLTDASQLIQLEGKIKEGGAIKTDAYTVDVFEQIEAYDLVWDVLEYSDVVLTKEGDETLYIGFEDYDEETYEPNGKYFVYPVIFDAELNMYVCEAFLEEAEDDVSIDIAAEGYTIKMDGAVPATIENIFVPSEKAAYNVALSEDGTKTYCFEGWGYYEDEDVYVEEYTVYNVIEHSKYGYLIKEIPNKTDLSGLVPQKIGENNYIDAYTVDTLVMNDGGSVAPGNVKGLKAETTAKGVKVSWTPVSKATKYRIYRKAEGEKKWSTLTTVTGEKTSSYVDETAKSGVKYYYTVKACNIVGWGTCNQKGVSVTYLKAPQTTLKSAQNGVQISWGRVAGAEKYRVYRKAAGETKWTPLKDTATLKFTDQTAKNGKTYTYAVKAIKGKVTSSFISVKTVFVATPKLASVKNTDSGAKISWNKVSGATKYRVYRKAEKESSWTKLGDTTKLSFTDKTAKSGVKYAYTVKAYNGSYGSNIDSKGLKNVFVPTPGLNSLVEAEKKGVTVFWQKVSTADKYVVYRKVDGKSWEKIASIKKADVKVDQYGNLYYIDTTAKNNVTYSYTVKAYDGGYASSFYTNRYITYFDPVTSLTAKATKNGVTLKWDAVKGAESYLVLRKDKNSDGYGIVGVAENATFIDETGEAGTKYTYAVKAYGGPSGKSGMSPTSKTVTVTYK